MCAVPRKMLSQNCETNRLYLLLLKAVTLLALVACLICPMVHASQDLQSEAFTYVRVKNFAKALECFNTASKENPESWLILQNIGNCHMELGHFATALSYFKKSVEVGGLHASQCNNLAAAYQRLGQNKRAQFWLQLACSLDPKMAADPSIQGTIRNLESLANNPSDSSTGPDYLSNLDSFKGWPPGAMPLKVYVRRNYQIPEFFPLFISIIRESLDQWCRAAGNAITYKFVEDRESADLICDYTDHPELVSSQHELGIEGNTEMLVKQDNTPGKANLVILVKDGPRAPTFRKRVLVAVSCLHELGHALGMHGHSADINDVMFAAASLSGKAKLSERDKETIKRIYGERSERLGVR